MIYYWWEPYLIQIFQSLASTSQQSEENMPSSTTQDTQKSSEEDESAAVVKSKNPYSIDAILRNPTSSIPTNTGVSPNTSNKAPIKRKLVEKEQVDTKNKNNELTIPASDLKTEKKIKREETSEEELKVVEDEENDD